ncbi:hypothetical protein EON63_06645 [archaeon]|nr:MAG: hypothetical protein EON63_06645 [archaeon]
MHTKSSLTIHIPKPLSYIELQNISRSNTISTSETSSNTKSPKLLEKRKEIDQEQLNNEIQQLDRAIQSIKEYILKRLEVAAVEVGQVPRMVTLCHVYKFSERETDLFTLLTVVQVSVPHMLCQQILDVNLVYMY